MLQRGDLHRGWLGPRGWKIRRLVQAWALAYWAVGVSGYLSGPRRLSEEQVRGGEELCKWGGLLRVAGVEGLCAEDLDIGNLEIF